MARKRLKMATLRLSPSPKRVKDFYNGLAATFNSLAAVIKANFVLSLPMLFLMAAASHYPMFGR
jgi:hypothetical protein